MTSLGWRYVLGEFRTEILTGSLPLAADVAARAAVLPGADGHLRMDVRSDRLILWLQTPEMAWVTAEDIDLARRISALAEEFRLTTRGGVGERSRSVQGLEIAIDAMDAGAIRPFWKAALGYVEEHGTSGATGALVDPLGEGPAIWFQQMDAPRPQRNRMHVDITVAHDEAAARLAAALAAGGTMVRDAEAPAYWVVADAEGNEACICTWQNRDERGV